MMTPSQLRRVFVVMCIVMYTTTVAGLAQTHETRDTAMRGKVTSRSSETPHRTQTATGNDEGVTSEQKLMLHSAIVSTDSRAGSALGLRGHADGGDSDSGEIAGEEAKKLAVENLLKLTLEEKDLEYEKLRKAEAMLVKKADAWTKKTHALVKRTNETGNIIDFLIGAQKRSQDACHARLLQNKGILDTMNAKTTLLTTKLTTSQRSFLENKKTMMESQKGMLMATALFQQAKMQCESVSTSTRTFRTTRRQSMFQRRLSELLLAQERRRVQRLRAKKEETTATAMAAPTYTEFRFTITKERKTGSVNDEEWCGKGCEQLGELELSYKGKALTPDNVAKAAGSGNSPNGEDASKAVDGNLKTKWLDGGWKRVGQDASINIKMKKPTSIDSFRFATADNFPMRDPVRFKLEGLTEGGIWVTLHEQTKDFPVSKGRGRWQTWVTFEETVGTRVVKRTRRTRMTMGTSHRVPETSPGGAAECLKRAQNVFQTKVTPLLQKRMEASRKATMALMTMTSLHPTLSLVLGMAHDLNKHVKGELKEECKEAGAVSKHLQAVRDLIEELDSCPEFHDFELKLPSGLKV